MAVIKIKAIKRSHKQTLDYIIDKEKTVKTNREQQQVMDYITDDVKTNDGVLVSGYNCTPEFSAAEFAMTQDLAKEVRGNFKNVGGADVRAYHLIQSFSPDDDVTPEEAHELGKKLMHQFLDGKHEFVIATHIDKEHIHNHIVFNATSFYDLKKFRSQPYLTVSKIRGISDKLCTEHGLNVLPADQPLKGNYKQYQKYRSMTTYRVQIRQRMNFLFERATDLSMLLEDARSLGVTIDLRGKHTTYHFGAQQRKTRANKLSDDDRFTKEGLEERITRNKGFVDFLESTIEDCFDQASSFSDFTQLLKQANVTFKRNRQGDVYFRLADFEQGTLSEAAINDGYRMDQIKACFTYDLPLQRLEKSQTMEEAFASRPQTLPTINETAIQLSSDLIAEQTKDGLLVNVVTPDGEHGQIFVDANHVEFLPTEKKYLVYLGPQFNYYFQQEGKQTNYFLKGEQLIRQLETMMQVPKVALEIPQTIIQSMNEKGIVLSFEREGIERLFLTKEEISIDPLSQKVTIHLSENWHYSYQRKHGEKKQTPYESLSGKQLMQLIEQNQPMLDTMLKYRLNNYQRKSSVLESKELANQLNLLRNDRIKDIPTLLKQMARLETQIQQTRQSLDSLKDKISEYNQVAKHLVAYQNYSWTKGDSSNQYKQEKIQFQTAEKFLADKNINPMVSSEKVIALIQSHQQEEKNLHEQIQHLGSKLRDYKKINQLLDELNERPSTQQKQKKEKDQERQLD